MRSLRLRVVTAACSICLLVLGLLGLSAPPAGAASAHYVLMTQQLAQGVRLDCVDLDYAVNNGLLETG